MANQNIFQVYTANPITVNAGTDLMYFGQSPYASSADDAGMRFSDFAAQFAPATGGSYLPLAGGTMTGGILFNGQSSVSPTLTKIRSEFIWISVGVSTTISPVTSNFLYEVVLIGADISDPSGYALYDDGYFFVIKNTSGGNCTFTPKAGEFIDGAASITILNQQSVMIARTSIGWSTIAESNFGGSGITSVQIQQQAFTSGLESGVANAYVLTLSPPLLAYTNNSVFQFEPTNNSTVAQPTLQINGLAAKSIINYNGNDLVPGDISATVPVMVMYSANGDQFRILNPQISLAVPESFQINRFTSGSASFVADSYTLPLSPVLGALVDNAVFQFNPAQSNATTAPTLAAGGSAAKVIVKQNQAPLVAGDIKQFVAAIVVYSSGTDTYQLLNPQTSTIVSPLTTKGDIYTFSTVNDRLPVGADGSLLIADSSQATGLRWDTMTGITSWTDVTGTSATLVASNGYLANNVGLVTFTMPATCPKFAIIRINGVNSGGWTIAQLAGQRINYNSVTTTVGVTGSLSSVNSFNCVELQCIVADTDFEVVNVVGNLSYA